MTTDWIDVSIPLRNGMPCWPGDRAFERQQMLSLDNGDVCNLSQISTTAHIGTHMDAPRHFVPGGKGIETMPLAVGIGPARVIAIENPEVISAGELRSHSIQAGERILFRTRNSDTAWNSDQFQTQFVYIPADAARYLAEQRVQMVGVDYMSVGGYNAPDNPDTHRILLQGGVWIIEGLNLNAVQPGDYDLICLPLRLEGSDGAPARAVLRKR